jgi:CRISPR-associated endonuclease/helicase Cas3
MMFDKFYQSRRHREPFPWMVRLAKQMASGQLPNTIDLATGSGKSDIVFIWAWAREANPRLPRRLWMVSDRRVIVDQSYEAAKLLEEPDGILVSCLRGGIVPDNDGILDPVRPQIITATVDQLGSRLLFRGYGASPRSWPIWAALAGTDSLVILDEAHLSPVAEDTFRACQQRLGAGIRVVSMSATPRDAGTTFALDQHDRAHPVLGRRLAAKRWVELRDSESLADAALELLREGCARVAVICNTVRAARATLDRLTHHDKHLVIGRQRPLDRDRLLADLLPRLKSGCEPSPPLVLVATQCIEAGADFDFDGMVSEACPIDALRQRLGRLDRLGNKGDSRCILVKPSDPKNIPPYGAAPDATWRWLAKNAKTRSRRKVIDLGSRGWDDLREVVPDEARSSRPEPVTFLEPHLRMLARTSPRPVVEPSIDLLLHGRDRAPGAVSLVWRREQVVELGDAEAASEILAIVPPSALESCEVPLWELKAWLSGTVAPADSGDVEGGELPVLPREDPRPDAKVLRWDGTEEGATLADVEQLRPGDVVVLASARGGYDAFGWNPASTTAVPDIADEAYRARTGRMIERINVPDADVDGDRVRRWSGGTVVETLPAEQKGHPLRDIEVPLTEHQQAVAKRAKAYAKQLGLDTKVAYQAGLHHDNGKADRRWQLCVNGGRLDRLAEPPLAKGRYVRSSLARLPERWRHEAESLARLPGNASPLLRWLVATHHGFGRPFWPSSAHGIGLAELMERLQVEHGVWGLALYEAVLRCADRAVSQEEEDAGSRA